MADERVAEFCARIEAGIRAPELAHLTHLEFQPPAPWVADAILRALDEQPPLVELRVSPGRGNNPALAYEGPLLLKRDGRLPRITVYWTAGKRNERMFAPEGAVSLAAAARLVLDYGYPVDTVELESPKGEVDGVAYEHPGGDARPILAFEAKQDDDELRALVVGVEACGGTGGNAAHRQVILAAGLPDRDGWPANHHKKCPFLCSDRPIGFWPVSPGLPRGLSGRIGIARPSGEGFVLEVVPAEMLHRGRLAGALAREM